MPIYQLYKHTLEALESNYKGSILKILEYVNDRLNVQDKGIQLFPIKEDVKKSDSIMNSKNLIKSETREIMSNDITLTTLKPVQVLTPGILTTQKSRNVDISELSLTLLSGLSPYLMEDITLTNENNKVKILFMLDMQTSSCQNSIADLLTTYCAKGIDVTNDLVSILENECYFSLFKSTNISNKTSQTIQLKSMEEVLLVLQKNILSDSPSKDYVEKKLYYDILKGLIECQHEMNDLDFGNIKDVSCQLDEHLKEIYDVETEIILK